MWTIFTWVMSKIGETAFGKLVLNQLEEMFPDLFKNKTKEIVGVYERRIEEKNLEIQRLQEEHAERDRQHLTEQERVNQSLKRRSISVEKLIGKYHKPLNAIIISYATQKAEIGGRVRDSHFIKDELARFNSKYLGGTDTLIPPRSVPETIKNRVDLEKWFSKEVLKGRYCKLKFLALIDIRDGSFWGSFLPYTQKKPMHFSIGEVLKPEDVFTDEQIRAIAINDVIQEGDIAWLASTAVSGEELQAILRNQKTIEGKLDRPSLRTLATGGEAMRDKIIESLEGIIDSPGNVASAIMEEARFWYERMRG